MFSGVSIVDFEKENTRICKQPLRKKCPYSEFFWFVFSSIRIEYFVSLRIQSEFEKTQTRKTRSRHTFHAVSCSIKYLS